MDEHATLLNNHNCQPLHPHLAGLQSSPRGV